MTLRARETSSECLESGATSIALSQWSKMFIWEKELKLKNELSPSPTVTA